MEQLQTFKQFTEEDEDLLQARRLKEEQNILTDMARQGVDITVINEEARWSEPMNFEEACAFLDSL